VEVSTGRLPQLSGPRVLLRPLGPADHGAWRAVRIRSRDWLERWEPLPELGGSDPVTDPVAFASRCDLWARQRHADTAYGFGIVLHDGTLVGEVSLGSVQRGPFQSALIGYWIDRAHAGHGLVPEAVVLVLRFGFEELGLHRLEAVIVPRNGPSRRVAEKLGLRDEGCSARFLQIQGVWEDHVRYAMTVEEWWQRREDLADRFLSPVHG
jgi:ribosomal-protein-alanine N-acetyltransferase